MHSTSASPTNRLTIASCLGRMFSAVTSAMQPARIPLALLAVLLIGALTPVVDLAGGKAYGPRGFASGPLSDTELELAYQRAHSATSRLASDELQALEESLRGNDATHSAGRRASLSELAGLVRDATAKKVAEREASGSSNDELELKRLRQRASEAMLVIDEAAPKGVATTFLSGERSAVRQAVNAIVKLDPEALLTSTLGAVFTLPIAAVRETPLVFPLALAVALCGISLLAGAVCRMAAVHAGRGGRLSPFEGSAFARARALNLVALPILPTILIALFALVVLAFVALLRVPVLNVVSGLLFVVPLLVALLGAVLAVTAVLSFPLMPAAIAVEDCDAGDAITRAAALALARPLLWIALLATSLVVLVIGGLIVASVLGLASGTVSAMLAAIGGEAGRALASGDASDIAALFGPDRLVGMLVGFWRALLDSVLAAYLFSLACDLATRAYLMMREQIDGENPATIAGYGIR